MGFLPRRWATSSVAVAFGAMLAASACGDPDVRSQPRACPNLIPGEGETCDPGLTCRYAEPTNCVPFFTATCSEDGQWTLEHPCGSGGTGGEAGGSEGGQGGATCIDSVPGAPTVTSGLTAVFPPDGATGNYMLTFSEPIADIMDHVTWSGAGTLLGVSAIGTSYAVRFAGMLPGDSGLITVDGITDVCGTAMENPVDIEVKLLPSCHVLEEEFEADFFAEWQTVDNATDGNSWGVNDDFDSPNGVPNHTEGFGSCATANDIDSSVGTIWDTELLSPAIDLTGFADVVLHFRSDFNDAAGAGDALVEASSDGVNWQPLAGWSDSHNGSVNLDLSSVAGGRAYLRWRYTNEGGVGAWWDIDDVCVESYTKVTCSCSPTAFTEINDITGSFNGNGSYTTGETTMETLTGVGQRVTVCGDLEDAALSGADFFGFIINAGTSGSPLSARVDYCIENAFEDATVGVWIKTLQTPLGITHSARNQGSYSVQVIDGPQHFVVLDAPDGYATAKYRVSVELEGLSMPIFTEGFEVWPPLEFTPTDEDPCVEWAQAPSTVVPSGALPTEGSNLAFFNSYDCNVGSEALESQVMSFIGLTNLTLQLDMYHDIGYPGSLDSVQVEYNEGGLIWTAIGAPLTRPGTVDAWETESVDLSALANKPSVKLRLFATTAYGNDIHIDNVKLIAF